MSKRSSSGDTVVRTLTPCSRDCLMHMTFPTPQRIALLRYCYRFLLVLEHITSLNWLYDLMLAPSDSSQLNVILTNLLCLALTRDSYFRSYFCLCYFNICSGPKLPPSDLAPSSTSPHPTPATAAAGSGPRVLQLYHQVFLKFAQVSSNVHLLFYAITPHLLDPVTVAHAIQLTADLIFQDGPRLEDIVETPAFRALLDVLKRDTAELNVTLALSAFQVLMHRIADSLPAFLGDLFAIFKRILFWHAPELLRLSISPTVSPSVSPPSVSPPLSPPRSPPKERKPLKHPSLTNIRDAVRRYTTTPDLPATEHPRQPAPTTNPMGSTDGVVPLTPPPGLAEPLPEALRKTYFSFFATFFELFPNNLLSYLRQQCSAKSLCGESMKVAILPLLRAISLHPSLVFDDVESELRLEHLRQVALLPYPLFGQPPERRPGSPPLVQNQDHPLPSSSTPSTAPLSTSENILGGAACPLPPFPSPLKPPHQFLAELAKLQRGLQSCLESGTDPSQSLGAPFEAPLMTDLTHQRDMLLLRNELLYERYLRQQYFNHYVEQTRASLETRAIQTQLLLAQAQVEQLQTKIGLFQRMAEERVSRFQEMESRYQQSHDELYNQLHVEKKEKQLLHDQLKKLQTLSAGQAETIDHLQRELIENTKQASERLLQQLDTHPLLPIDHQISHSVTSLTLTTQDSPSPPQNLDSTLTNLSSSNNPSSSSSNNQSSSSSNNQLSSSSNHHASSIDSNELEMKLLHQETMLHSYESRIKNLELENDELQKRLENEHDVIGKLIEEKESVQEQHQALLQEFQIQSEFLSAKLKILESRYHTVKNINGHLQRRLLETDHFSQV